MRACVKLKCPLLNLALGMVQSHLAVSSLASTSSASGDAAGADVA